MSTAAIREHGSGGRPGWVRTYIRILLVMDALAAGTAGVATLALIGRNRLDPIRIGAMSIDYWIIVIAIVPIWLVLLSISGAYDSREIGNGSEEYRRVFTAALQVVAVVAIVSFAARLDIARGFVATMPPIGVGLTLFGRYRVRKWVHRQRARGRYSNKVVVVGSREHARDLVRHLHRTPFAGFRVFGACVPGGGDLDVDGVLIPVLGTPAQVEDVAAGLEADAIAISDVANLASGALRRIAWSLEGTGVDLIVVPAVTDVAGPRIAIRPVAGLPLLHVEEPVRSGPVRAAKDGTERFLAAFALVALSPIWLCIALGIRVTSPGPVLYKQTRVGKDGRHFTLWKFRTMYKDADQRLAEVAHLNDHDGGLFKIRNDPRRTRIGRWLRRFSIDELPQIVHVVTGRMSIVGPRPPLPTEVERYDEHTSRRLLVKPGLTGLWQVSGRADLNWDESVRLDLYYVENWSPALDAVILWKTISAVVRGRGAY
ncbi:MAG: hypothetical protein QOF21_1643 [Actinomycetota bacterium]|jgi:exopolysaccharide biosynthesis polyprenyl glycosylphosphotransferase